MILPANGSYLSRYDALNQVVSLTLSAKVITPSPLNFHFAQIFVAETQLQAFAINKLQRKVDDS